MAEPMDIATTDMVNTPATSVQPDELEDLGDESGEGEYEPKAKAAHASSLQQHAGNVATASVQGELGATAEQPTSMNMDTSIDNSKPDLVDTPDGASHVTSMPQQMGCHQETSVSASSEMSMEASIQPSIQPKTTTSSTETNFSPLNTTEGTESTQSTLSTQPTTTTDMDTLMGIPSGSVSDSLAATSSQAPSFLPLAMRTSTASPPNFKKPPVKLNRSAVESRRRNVSVAMSNERYVYLVW